MLYHIVDVTINSSTWSPVVAPIEGDIFVLRNTGPDNIRVSPDNGATEDTLKPDDQFSILDRPYKLPHSGLRHIRFVAGETILWLRSTGATFDVKILFPSY